MAIHWQVKFKSLRQGVVYTVNIYDDNYTGNPVQLIGAAEPFSTQEEDDEDMFTPVRLQSGYLRIIDDGTVDWRDIIPASDTDRPVTLTHDNNGQTVVDWVGFIQPQNFGAQLYVTPQQIDYPLQCPLTVLNGEDINYSQPDLKNFAYLLKTIVDVIPATCRPNLFIVQGGGDAQQWLRKRIDWRNFMRDGKAAHNMHECLEAMCKFWGWTARMYRDILYLVCPDDATEDGFVEIDYEELTAIANGSSSVIVGTDAFETDDMLDGFANDDNLDSQLRGPGKVTITADPNTADDIICDPLDNEFEYKADELGWTYGVSYGNQTLGKTGVMLLVNRNDFIFQSSAFASFTRIKKYDSNSGYGEPMNMLEIKTSYQDGMPLMSMQMKYAHSYSSGFFMLHGTTYQGGNEYVEVDGYNYEGNRELFAKLYVVSPAGTKYWNGREWQVTPAEFVMTVGNRKPRFFTRYWVASQQAETNSIIETPDSLYGILHFEILGSTGSRGFPETDGMRSMNLRDFRIEFVKRSTVAIDGYPNSGWKEISWKRQPNAYTYTASNSNRTRDEYTEDNIFCTDDSMKPGYGVLLNPDGSYLESVNYGTATERPEQHKADRIASYWSASKRKLEVNMRADASMNTHIYGNMSPIYKLSLGSNTLYPISISRKWRDDVVKLVLMEI